MTENKTGQEMEAEVNDMLEDAQGAVSVLRICVLFSVAAGIATMAAGIVGFFHRIPDAMLVIGSGQALITLVLTLKVWQRSIEEKGE
jgi:hypothetical protein